MVVQPNTQNPGILQGTMTDKKATLYDPATGKPTVVGVGTPQASQLQSKGYTLQPKNQAVLSRLVTPDVCQALS